MEALCLKCPINTVVRVTDLEVTHPRFNARLRQCLRDVFDEAVTDCPIVRGSHV